MDNTPPFTTNEDNQALASSKLFVEALLEQCKSLQGHDFTVLTGHCTHCDCGSPLIVMRWHPKDDWNELAKEVWQDTPLPKDLPRVMTVHLNGTTKQVAVNHEKVLQQ